MLIITKSNLIAIQPDKDCFINSLCKRSVLLIMLAQKFPKVAKNLSYMHASLPKSNMMIFSAKLTSSSPENLSMLTIELSKILLQVLISSEKDSKPFWKPAYAELSAKLWSPIEIALLTPDTTSSPSLLNAPVGSSPLLMTKVIKVANMSSHKSSVPSFTTTAVDTWEKEATKPGMKSVKIRLKINQEKRELFQKWMYSSNYSYNKTIAAVRAGNPINFQYLRNKLVTANTKKTHPEYQRLDAAINTLRKSKKTADDDTKTTIDKQIVDLKTELMRTRKEMKSISNPGVFEWELSTPKEIRAEAVQDVCKAYKTVFTQMKTGNIKRFQLGFRKKNQMQHCMVISKKFIQNKGGKLIIGRSYFSSEKDAEISMGKKTIKKYRDLHISHDCRMVKKNNEYWLVVPVDVHAYAGEKRSWKTYCGVDPGVRTFMTTFGTDGCHEHEYNSEIFKSMDKKISLLKKLDKRIRKRTYLKCERRKEHIIDEIHWKTIREMLAKVDVVFYGDIKSHGIVRHKKNHTLNRDTNNLKFYQFKQRLEFKAMELGKKVVEVKEHYTTKTCSFCGTENNPGISKVYRCKSCKCCVGRDVNAAKNILMKGMMPYL
jgi:IS605 OrfB family transposase